MYCRPTLYTVQLQLHNVLRGKEGSGLSVVSIAHHVQPNDTWYTGGLQKLTSVPYDDGYSAILQNLTELGTLLFLAYRLLNMIKVQRLGIMNYRSVYSV